MRSIDDLVGVVERADWRWPPRGRRRRALAVAWVIKHQAESPGWWGDDLVSVCHKPDQFSCWNAGDPNRERCLRVQLDDAAVARTVITIGNQLLIAQGADDVVVHLPGGHCDAGEEAR